MNENFIPTTEHVREAYSVILEPKGEKLSITLSPEREAEFDYWLEAHDREVAAKTLRDAAAAADADDLFRDPLRLKSDWIRARADNLEKGTS